MKTKVFIPAFVFLLAWQLTGAQAKQAANEALVKSPDGAIALKIFSHNGGLRYQVTYRQHLIIEPSAMGLVVNDTFYGSRCTVGKASTYSANETFDYRGVHSKAINHYNGIRLSVLSPTSPLVIDARVFNDGVAFRYIVNRRGPSVISSDTTSFMLPAGNEVWSQPDVKYYEGRYHKKKIEDYRKDELAGPPVTAFNAGSNSYLAITEGGLTDFAGMSLRADGNRGFHARFSGSTGKTGVIETSWRIIQVGKDLNTLVNCDIVPAVSPPYDRRLFPQGYNTDWVKPGRSVWSWLADHGDVTLENMKRFTDLASALGFEYNLVDEGWSYWKDSANGKDAWDMMKELVDYSASRGVRIWVWKAYPDRGGIPGIKEPQQRQAFFQHCKDLGIAGMKVDFFNSENQEIIDFYQAALSDAASYHLMMDFHGANKPTGETRTWPNELSREGIRGLENRPPWAETNTTVPFTRYLAGHADYTPVHFGKRLGEVSWSHQVATMVVFTSPFLCLGADPQSILDNPAKSLIQSVPPTWDETLVLPQSAIGELVLFARRKGITWFLAGLNGRHEPAQLNVDLSFLGKGSYRLASMSDDTNRQDNAIFQNAVVNSGSMTIHLNPEGGFVGRFEKLK